MCADGAIALSVGYAATSPKGRGMDTAKHGEARIGSPAGRAPAQRVRGYVLWMKFFRAAEDVSPYGVG